MELACDIAEGLRDRGIATDLAYDGTAALQKGAVYGYDVIVLDRDLPALHGDAVCVALRESGSDARILMLTAAATIGDRVGPFAWFLSANHTDSKGQPLAYITVGRATGVAKATREVLTTSGGSMAAFIKS